MLLRRLTQHVRNPNWFAASLTLALTIALASCSDWYSDPVLLPDQHSLSDVHADRPMYSALYYEGKTRHMGRDVHVFAMRVVSKFTGQGFHYIYYLPVAEMTIETDVGAYPGEGSFQLRYRLTYEHDKGEFRLSARDRKSEFIPANFSEQYSYKESRYLNAIEKASSNSDYAMIKYVGETCFWSGNYAESAAFAERMLDSADRFDRTTSRGQKLHDYHTLMGRLLVQEGEIGRAGQHLLDSIKVPPPQS